MPRTYTKKKPEPTYTIRDIENAVFDVQNKNLTYRAAEERYNVPLSVIFHRIKGRHVSMERIGAGRAPVLSIDTENQLEKCLVARAQMGFPCDKEELLNLIAEYVQINNIKSPFKDNKPGQDWYSSFMKRHPRLSLKKPEHLQKCRKTARKPNIIYDFYEKLKQLSEETGLSLPNRECLIFNADESGFNNDPSRIRAIGEKGKSLSRVSGGSGRDVTTVLACISADGRYLPPLIVFKGAAVQARWTSDKACPGTVYGASTNGWMEEPQFFHWFSNVFIKHVTEVRETNTLSEQTALLLYDGHASHISVRIVEAAIENNIKLMRFPSHLTDRLQPLDKCVFGPIKTKWEKKLVEYGKTQMGKGTSRLPKSKFVELLADVWKEGMVASNIIAGFVTTGICPVNPARFPEDLFDPVDLENYKKRMRNNPETPTTDLETVSDDKNNDTVSQSTANLTIGTAIDNHVPVMPETKIIDIFAKKLVDCNTLPVTAGPSAPKQVVTPRLKQMNYGEVLTTADILLKLKEAEILKQAKLAKKGTKRKNSKIKTCEKKNKDLPTNLTDGEEGLEKETISKISRGTKCEKKNKYLSDSEEDLEELILDSESEDNLTVEELIEAESVEEVEYQDPVWDEITTGKYILVDFVGGLRKKTHYQYVCVVQSVDDSDGDISIMGLKACNSTRKEFTLNENDVSSISFDQIRAVLPNPEMIHRDRKVIYVFPGCIDIFEKA